MPIKISMPALSPTMTEGNLAKWVKKEGDKVQSGDVIAEIETDKAIMEVESVDDGVLGKILIPEGTENVKVSEVIALLLEEGESAESLKTYQVTSINTQELKESSKGNEFVDVSASTNNTMANKESRLFATPLAKRMANKAGIDLQLINGTGPYGRIVRDDVESALNKNKNSFNSDLRIVNNSIDKEPKLIKIDQMRKTIARRLTESKQQIPHFYLSVDCGIDNLLAIRKKFNSLDESNKLTVNDFVIKAVAHALIEVPQANISWSDEGIIQYHTADISVAVALSNGLITPIIKSAEIKGLKEISVKAKDLIKRANDGKLKPEEFQGGNFTISNLGMYGVKDFKAIINPPQACILAVGAGEQRVIARNGEMVIATVMACTLSVDHRVVDGIVGAKFLSAFKRFIEEPVFMLA